MNPRELRRQCADHLRAAVQRARQLTAFVGLDGFVDEIIHVVDKRENSEVFHRVSTLAQLAGRIAAAAGKSTNLEVVTQQTKLGGNGPILANALASLGVRVTYLGALGYPNVHPVFHRFTHQAEVHSIAEPGFTDALEFEDGKLMLCKTTQLQDIHWAGIQARFGRDRFAHKFDSSDLIAFVNWTMIPHMSQLWQSLQTELCPAVGGPRRMMFFDLADPEKRLVNDIARALELIQGFERYFDVCLGLNEKEAMELSRVLGLRPPSRDADGLSVLAREIMSALPIHTLVIHPVRYALAISQDALQVVEGPFVEKPVITTGAGDHFNAGFCLGRLLDFDHSLSLLTGVTTSGFYVRTGRSPSMMELSEFLSDWPGD